MLKKIFCEATFILFSLIVYGQNVQLHADFRHSLYSEIPSPNFVTATYELFKPDKWGTTFLFVDLDFNRENGNIGLAYTEIARDFRICNFPVMPHIEYNGGLVRSKDGAGFPISNAYLAGASYSFGCAGAQFNTYLAYKLNAFEKNSHDAQWTVSWNASFLNNRISLSGFLDIWTENRDRTGSGIASGKKLVLLAEPQFWYNITENLAVGSEIEISDNFALPTEGKVYFLPTVAAKWTF
ncbi:MAG: DUF5020 family protein [Bacteroidales bacterium]|jgi:hypothetical protein|nr:DUF5020 family protein [Bacteroidales bacterium]